MFVCIRVRPDDDELMNFVGLPTHTVFSLLRQVDCFDLVVVKADKYVRHDANISTLFNIICINLHIITAMCR